MRIHRTLIAPAVGIVLGGLAVAGIGATVNSSAAAASDASVKCAADYSPIPVNWSTEKGGLDIGRLVAVTSVGGVVKVRIDRVSFYRGAEAVALNHGEEPVGGYLDTDTDSREQTFTLDPKASIEAENMLRNDPDAGVEREKLTSEQLVHNANRADEESGIGALVWLRHTDGMNGTITALAEQYTP
jgi:hypothetical protein